MCSYKQQSSKVEVPQKQLCFVREPALSTKKVGSNRVIAEEVLMLLNNTDVCHAFKIRTTARDRYRVEPSCAVIKRGEKFAVKLSMVHAKEYKNDMFQIRCVPLSEAMVEEAGKEDMGAMVKENAWWNGEKVLGLRYDFTLDSIVVDSNGNEIVDLDREIQESEAARRGTKPEKAEPEASMATRPATIKDEPSSSLSDDKYDAQLKIVIIGDTGVGKSCILNRFSENLYSESHVSTIGADFKMRTLLVKGKKVRLQIWDTAGQNRFKLITSAYYRGADGILVVYDITNTSSFEAVEDWIKEIEKMKLASDVPMMVLGNKSDLESERKVAANDAQRWCSARKLPLAETSAAKNIGVDGAFLSFSESMLEWRERRGEGLASMSSMDARKPALDFGAGQDTPPLIGAAASSSAFSCSGCLAAFVRKVKGEPYQGYSEY